MKETKESSRTTVQRPAAQRESSREIGGPGSAAIHDSLRMVEQRARTTAVFGGGVAQRAGPEEEPLQGAFKTAQRAGPEEELPLQGAFETAQRAGLEEELPAQGAFETAQRAGPDEEEPLQGAFKSAAPANRTGLPDKLKAGVESLSGMDLSNVRVHRGSSEPDRLAAHAFARGDDIHVAPGQERHLAHEAWHVVQQRQGRVAPTTQMQGVSVNDDQSLEHEADIMGAKAAGKA